VRNGGTLVEDPLAYHAPNLAEESTVPYRLMWIPAVEPSALTGDLLRATVRGILTGSYELEDDDPLIEEVLAGLLYPDYHHKRHR
jgi:hypothetical protein